MRDLLGRIVVAPKVMERWITYTRSAEVLQRVAGLRAEEVPDEMAREEEDGSLTLYVTLPRGRGEISMRIEPDEWEWSGTRVQ